VLYTVYNFVIGFTIEEQAVYPLPGERDKRYDAVAARVAENGDQVLTAITAEAFDENVDGRFEDGLRIVLLGAQAWLS
jgi:hypothetical protein